MIAPWRFLDQPVFLEPSADDGGQTLTLLMAHCDPDRVRCGRLPAGEGPPPHVHHNEDDGFYVLEGEVSITCGEQTWTAVPGSFAMLPRGVPHSFTVSPAGNARMLQITSPAQFERFAAEMGEPAISMTMPKHAEVDIPKLLGIVPRYGIEMLPPPH